MPGLRLTTTAAVLFALVPLPLCAQPPAESPRNLMRDVIYNELHDPERKSHWEYLSHCVTPDKNLVRRQVETDQGPVFRVLEKDGAPLDAAQQHKEDQRLADYIQDPAEIARVRREHEQDEERLAAVMTLLPQAFLFRYEAGTQGDTVRIDFRPDPAFVPSGYEARILHALAGTLTVDTRFKRLIDMRGLVSERVDFGYGFLGHVQKGGTFEIHRRQVSPRHWKTDLVNVHIQGKILMFRNVSKDQRESRSDFRPVPTGTTLAAAEAMLSGDAIQTQTAQASFPAAE